LGNAVKFTHQGHVLINVEWEDATPDATARRGDAEATLRISVEDTGIGIPDEQLDRIFEKFTQADASTTRQYGGTGLGRAISRHRTELMGGTLGVASRPGGGSTFWFTLRLPIAGGAEPAPAPNVDFAGVRVLIVDDNEVNRRVLHEHITSWGMRNGS